MQNFMKRWVQVGLVVSLWAHTPDARAMDMSLNGFGSLYYGQAFNKGLLPYGFDDSHANFTSFSQVGINLGGVVNDDLDFAAQFVALGQPVGSSDSFGMIAQWAYLNYKPTQNTSLRLGRQLFPSLQASEYVRVGYLLPFRQIPYNVFGLLPFTRFDGASAYQTFDTQAGKLTFGLFGGRPLLDVNNTLLSISGLRFKFAELIGTQITLDGDGWRIRAQASRFFSQLLTSAPLPASDLTGSEQNYSVGYRYDKSRIVSWGEYVWVRTPNGTPGPTGRYAYRGYGFYTLAGYRIGKFLPRYTFSKGVQEYNVQTNGSSTTHNVGLNYQAGQGAVIKVEYQRDIVPQAQGGGYFVTQPVGSTAKSGASLYAGVDFIF